MKDKKFLVVALILSIAIITVSMTYAFFQAQGGESVTRDVRIQTHTTDLLTFDIEDDIELVIGQEDFQSGGENVSGETNVTAILRPNSGTGAATETYNVYLNIDANGITYSSTNTNHDPELMLQVFDENDELVELEDLGNVKTIKGVTGYDITGVSELITILSDWEISTSNNVVETDTWKVVVTLINLDVEQNDNTGKEVTATIVIQKDEMIQTGPMKIEKKMLLNSGYKKIDAVPARSSLTSYDASEGTLFKTNNAEMGDPVLYYAGQNPNNWVIMGQITILEKVLNYRFLNWSDYFSDFEYFESSMISNRGLCVSGNTIMMQNNGDLISESYCSDPKLKVCLTTDGSLFADFYSETCEEYDETWVQVTEYGNPTWLPYGAKENNTYDMYWRIIRTNEESTGSGTRLLFSGLGNSTNQDGTKRIDPNVNNAIFCEVDSDGDCYAYYSYDDLEERITSYTYGNSNDSLDTIRGTNDNLIKDQLEDWYDAYIINTGLSSLIDTKAVYCNDRSYTDNSVWPYNLTLGGLARIDNYAPSFACGATTSGYPNFNATGDNNADRYTGETYELGNGLLGNKPVALMTADESLFAGKKRWDTSNTWIFRNPNNQSISIGEAYFHPDYTGFYTMTPIEFKSSYIINQNGVGSAGTIGYRPVLSIKKDVKVTGSGTPTDPYIVVTN